MASHLNRKVIIGISIIVLFALLIISITFYFNSLYEERSKGHLTSTMIDNMSKQEIADYMNDRHDSEPVLQSFFLLPFIAFIGLLVGTIVFYIMSDKVAQKEMSLEKNSKLILNFLTGQERKIIETLLEHGGKVQQYELSHLPNLNKVKTHRILLNLEEKGIVQKEKLGKINKIVLNKELFEILK